jgi:penicillin-binding protein 2
MARFAVHRHEFTGIDIRARLSRHYPMGAFAVHALGYVAAISEQDLKRIDATDYAGTTLIGKLGVEGAYEEELHGTAGYREVLVNAAGRPVLRQGAFTPKLETQQPVAGADLILSIDARVQRAAEEALAGMRGAAVAIDPHSGDVIALASTPEFDPNGFARGLSNKQYDELQTDIDKPLINRALRGAYPPGSTVKPFFALAGLRYDVITPEKTIFCPGHYNLPGSSHQYRDWLKKGHGTIAMRRAIAQSCDVYFYQVAEKLGIDRMHEFMGAFGFGEDTGIDIPGEKPGLMPSTEWKRRTYKRAADQVWFPGETIIVGIGQGYMLATPLQLAHAVAAMAARGQVWKPRLVTATREPGSSVITHRPAVPDAAIAAVTPEQWNVVIEGMEEAALPGGTAANAMAGVPYKVAGKTGSAQVFSIGQNEKYNEKEVSERMLDHALFISFAPADDPKLAVAVFVENGKHGASTAAPIARRMFDAYLLPDKVQPARTP